MNIDDFIPVNGRILLEVLPDDSIYDGAIIRMDAGQEKSNLALVKAIDTSYNESTPIVTVGDIVMFNKHSGTVLKIDRFDDKQPEYRIIKPDDIFGLIKD